jgi:carbon-monoxide dehydrogenase medium subunit
MSKFLSFQRYRAPETQAELLQVLCDEGPRARVLAGGTDVFVAMKEKGLHVECLVDIKRVLELRGIVQQDGKGVAIGAATTLHEVETSPLVQNAFPALSYAVGQIGSVQVRNRGTLGGNLSNASPAADSTPALLVLDAQFELVSNTGQRCIPADTFFVGPGKSVLGSGEILRRVLIPPMKPGQRAAYIKFGPRRAMDIAVVGVAVSLVLDKNNKCKEARVALASVAPIPLRARQAEAALVGELTDARIKEAAKIAADEAKPIDDVRGSAAYRKHLIQVLVKHAVQQILAQARPAGK